MGEEEEARVRVSGRRERRGDGRERGGDSKEVGRWRKAERRKGGWVKRNGMGERVSCNSDTVPDPVLRT